MAQQTTGRAALVANNLPTAKTVTGATNATPIVVTTSTAHNVKTNEIIRVSGVGGNTAANGDWIAGAVTSTTVALLAYPAGTNSTGSGAYTSGGSLISKGFGITVPVPNDLTDMMRAGMTNVPFEASLDRDAYLMYTKLDVNNGSATGTLTVDNLTVNGVLTVADYPTLATPDTYTRIYPHTFIADDETEWTIPTLVGGVTRDGRKEANTPLLTPNSGRFVFIRIEGIPADADINGAYVWLKGGAGHGGLPAVMPNAYLQKQNITNGTASSGSAANDASGTVGAYEATHSIHVTSGFSNWDPTATMLYLVFQSEYGVGGVAGLELYTVQLDVTISQVGK